MDLAGHIHWCTWSTIYNLALSRGCSFTIYLAGGGGGLTIGRGGGGTDSRAWGWWDWDSRAWGGGTESNGSALGALRVG